MGTLLPLLPPSTRSDYSPGWVADWLVGAGENSHSCGYSEVARQAGGIRGKPEEPALRGHPDIGAWLHRGRPLSA